MAMNLALTPASFLWFELDCKEQKLVRIPIKKRFIWSLEIYETVVQGEQLPYSVKQELLKAVDAAYSETEEQLDRIEHRYNEVVVKQYEDAENLEEFSDEAKELMKIKAELEEAHLIDRD